MKKILFPVLVVLMLSWSYSTVFAQGDDTKKEQEKTPRADLRQEHRRADANDPLARARAMEARHRVRQREGREKRRQEMMKARAARRSEREKARSARDIEQFGAEFGKGGSHEQQLKGLRRKRPVKKASISNA